MEYTGGRTTQTIIDWASSMPLGCSGGAPAKPYEYGTWLQANCNLEDPGVLQHNGFGQSGQALESADRR